MVQSVRCMVQGTSGAALRSVGCRWQRLQGLMSTGCMGQSVRIVRCEDVRSVRCRVKL